MIATVTVNGSSYRSRTSENSQQDCLYIYIRSNYYSGGGESIRLAADRYNVTQFKLLDR